MKQIAQKSPKTKAEWRRLIKRIRTFKHFFTIPMIIHDIKVICSKSFDLSEELT